MRPARVALSQTQKPGPRTHDFYARMAIGMDLIPQYLARIIEAT